MILQLILFLLAGIGAGIVVGLLPGLHPNLIAALVIFGDYNTEISVLLFSCLITSNIFEFLSACYLGVPEEGEALTKMPLHNLLLQKRGLAGMKIVSFSSVITYAVFLGIGFFLKEIVYHVYYFVKNYAWVLLAGIAAHLIIKEKSIRKGLLFFALSGVLGVITFNLNLNDPFLPLLTGLFGLSSLIDLKSEEKSIPKQMKKVVVESNFFEILTASIFGIIASIIMAVIPSMSPSQVGLVTEEIKKSRKSDELKIASMTSINIADNILSLIALSTINKARSGVVQKISEIMPLTEEKYYLLLLTGFFACTMAAFLLIKFAGFFSDKAAWFNSKKVKIGIILFVLAITLAINGFLGFAVLLAATIIGYYCIANDVRRSQLLGSLVVPTLIFYISIM